MRRRWKKILNKRRPNEAVAGLRRFRSYYAAVVVVKRENLSKYYTHAYDKISLGARPIMCKRVCAYTRIVIAEACAPTC